MRDRADADRQCRRARLCDPVLRSVQVVGVVVTAMMTTGSGARGGSGNVARWHYDHNVPFADQIIQRLGELPDMRAVVRLVVPDADVEDPNAVGVD